MWCFLNHFFEINTIISFCRKNKIMKFYTKTLLIAFAIICLVSCKKSEKELMIDQFNVIYDDILDLNFDAVEKHLDGPSKAFYDKVTSEKYLNIDSIIVLGTQNNMKYMLTDYLALNGDEIKLSNKKTDFYRFLGNADVSLFSFGKGFYVEKGKSKVGKEYFISLLRDDLTTTKRTWVKLNKDENGTYKLDLIYLLKLHEASLKKTFAELRSQYPKKTPNEVLSHFYWQNSGKNPEEYVDKMKKMEAFLLNTRKNMITTYEAQGKR